MPAPPDARSPADAVLGTTEPLGETAMRDYLDLMVRYNRWANDRLYAAAAGLPERDYFSDRGAFFRSVHGTLNHLLLVDRRMLARLSDGPVPDDALDAVLYPDLPSLTAARRQEDDRLNDTVGGLSDADLARMVPWQVSGIPDTRLDQLLITLFHHQTHHRGQVHTLLTQCGQTAPDLDVVEYIWSNRPAAGAPQG